MKYKLVIFFFLFGFCKVNGQSVFKWAQVGNELGDYDEFTSDSSGNIYQARFSAFSKYNSSGNKIWEKDLLKSVSTTANINVNCIIISQNTIIISGSIYMKYDGVDSIDFDPGPCRAYLVASKMNNGSCNAYMVATKSYNRFIAKYDMDGNFIWAKKIEDSGDDDFLNIGIKADNFGNIYIAGTFRGTIDFDPGPKLFTFSASNNTAYFAKYNSSGNFIWAKKIVNNDIDGIDLHHIALDGSNNIYLDGTFKRTIDFDPGTGKAVKTSIGPEDAFLAKYDMNGGFMKVSFFGDKGSVYSSNLSTDVSGNVYLIGAFSGTVDFDPGIGKTILTASENGDQFIAKFSTSGNILWTKKIEGSIGIGSADLRGNSYMLADNGTAVIFSKYSDNGNVLWVQRLGTFCPSHIVPGNNKNIFLTGIVFEGSSADLNPGAGHYILKGSAKDETFFFANYSQ